MPRKKGEKEFRAGIGIWHGQGIYFYAKNKKEAVREARKAYAHNYRGNPREEIKERNVRVWRNADGSMPAWRKKADAKKKR